jgi:hypothetical protein
VAWWDGAAWSSPGGGLDDAAQAVTTAASHPALGLVVAGNFDGIGGVAASDLAAWDGGAWRDLGAPASDDGGPTRVSALAACGDGLFAGGRFDGVDGVAARRLAWFDGQRWWPLAAGLVDEVTTLAVLDGLLVAGTTAATDGGVAAWAY